MTLGFSDWHYANPDEIFIRGGNAPDFKKGVVAGLRMAADMAVGDDLYMAQAMLMMAKQIEDTSAQPETKRTRDRREIPITF
jgi:hypothetical protein